MKDSISFECLFPSHQVTIEYLLMWGRHGCEIKKAIVILLSEGKKMSVLMLLAIKAKGIHPTPCPSLSKLELMISHCGYINSNMVQFTQSCPTLCDRMNHSMPGLPVHHQLPKFTQTHVHRVSDAIQPSHPLLSPSLTPSPPAPNHPPANMVNGTNYNLYFLYQQSIYLKYQAHL